MIEGGISDAKHEEFPDAIWPRQEVCLRFSLVRGIGGEWLAADGPGRWIRSKVRYR